MSIETFLISTDGLDKKGYGNEKNEQNDDASLCSNDIIAFT